MASQAGPDDLALVPAGAAVVAYANVHDVMQSEFRQRLTAAMDSSSEGRHKFQEETGIDIEQDIDSVVAAGMPKAGGTGHGNGFVALRGRFDTTRIEALVSSKGGVMDEYRGARLLLPPVKTDEQVQAGHDGPPAIALVSANLVIVGSLDAVKAAIDRQQDQGGPSILSDGEFVQMLEALDGGSSMWAIGRSSVLMTDESDLPDQLASKLPGVKWVAASGHVNGGLRASFRAEANDADAGKNLRDIVQGALAIARLQLDGKPELAPLLQGLQVEGSGTTVSVNVAMPTELLELLIAEAHRHAGGGAKDSGTRAEE
jgi:hypothetical protein